VKTERSLAAGAAPGKVILFGEHSVVYGQPAIAAALGHGLGATVETYGEGPLLRIPRWGSGGLEVRPSVEGKGDAMCRAFALALQMTDLPIDAGVRVTIDGQLPLGVGLGSSAAFAVALLRGLADHQGVKLSADRLSDGADAIERIFHGNPSGLDHTVVITGQCLHFNRAETPKFRQISLGAELPIVIGWTPRAGTTREAVAQLRARRDHCPGQYDELFAAMGRIAEVGARALEEGDLTRIGALFDLNHGYLNACGVSSLANEEMVHLARRAGALGAKLTGAGRGGASIALVPENPDKVVKALKNAGFDALFTTVR
jgi:hydroxymethylglutaryl-CoA reductase